MAFVLGDRPIRPFTVEQVLRMVDLGLLPEDGRLELLHGMLTETAVKSPEHCELKRRIVNWLGAGERYEVRIESVLVVADHTSLPEPDIALVPPGDYLHAHPEEAQLVIEVANTSLTMDLEIKPPLYAATGIPDYWVIDIPARRVRVHRDPTPDGYAARTTHGPTGTLQPLAVDVEPLDLAALFDGLR